MFGVWCWFCYPVCSHWHWCWATVDPQPFSTPPFDNVTTATSIYHWEHTNHTPNTIIVRKYQVSLLVHCKYIRAYPVGTVHDCCLMDEGLVCESALARNTLQVSAPPVCQCVIVSVCVCVCLCLSVRLYVSPVCLCVCVCSRTKHFASACTAH